MRHSVITTAERITHRYSTPRGEAVSSVWTATNSRIPQERVQVSLCQTKTEVTLERLELATLGAYKSSALPLRHHRTHLEEKICYVKVEAEAVLQIANVPG